MTLTKIFGIVAAVAALGLSNVYAEDAIKTTEVQKAEAQEAVHKTGRGWASDVNQDGKISYEEFRAAGEQRMENHFKRMDANGDGFIDQTEKQAMREKWGAKHKVRGERCYKPDGAKAY